VKEKVELRSRRTHEFLVMTIVTYMRRKEKTKIETAEKINRRIITTFAHYRSRNRRGKRMS
jgi:hypothetical protein